MGKLVRKETDIYSVFTPTVRGGGKHGALLTMRTDTGDEKTVYVHLWDWQVRDLAKSCIRHLDIKAEAARDLAQQARNP